MKRNSYSLKTLQGNDPVFLSTLIVLVSIGLVTIYSASSEVSLKIYKNPDTMIIRHSIFTLMGLVTLFITSSIPFRIWKKLSFLGVGISLVFLVAILLVPEDQSHHGAVRWLTIGSIRFQPSELAKYALVVFLATWLTNKQEDSQKVSEMVLIPLGFASLFAGLVLLQRDLSTAVLFVMIALVLVFLGGAKKLHLFFLSGLFAIVAFIFAWSTPYRRSRIMTFIAPNIDIKGDGYQLFQSWISFGRGGLFGVGVGDSRQKLAFLPDAHTDFVFSIIGEERGFIGALFVLILFMLLIWRGYRIASRCPDTYGRLLAGGLISTIGLYAMLNMMIATGRVPTSGLPMPFISYGGTSLVLSLAAMGIVLNISRYSHIQNNKNRKILS